jgi:hypothetical protein
LLRALGPPLLRAPVSLLLPLLWPLVADVKQTPHRGTAAPSPWLWLPSPLRAVLLVVLVVIVLQYPSLPSPPPRRLAIAAFKKLSEVSLVPIPQEPMQPLVDEDALPPKFIIYGVYDPTGELHFVGNSRNVRAALG